MRILIALILNTGLLASVSATAADTMEPGLWEIQNRTTIDGERLPNMQEMLKDVPPEVRAQMKGAMAMQGIGLEDSGVRICISEAQAARNDVPVIDEEENCTITRTEQSAGHWVFDMQCSNPAGSGTGDVQLIDSKHWKSHYTMQREGHPDYNTMEIHGAGRWLSSDCGAITPQQR